MKKLFAIFNIYNKIWKRQLGNIINSKTKKAILVTSILAVLFFSSFCGYLMTNEILELFLTGNEKSIYLLLITICITASTISTVFFTLFECLTPNNNIINTILKWMPIKKHIILFGIYIPTIINIVICTSLFIFLLYLPSMFFASISVFIILVICLCIIFQSLLITLILITFNNIMQFITCKAKIPFSKNIATTIVLLSCIMFFVNYSKGFTNYLLNYEIFSYNPITLLSGLFLLFYNNLMLVEINYALWLFLLFLIFCLFYFSLFLKPTNHKVIDLRLFRFIPFTKSKNFTLIAKEVKISYRNEENILFITIILIGLLIIRSMFKITIALPYTSIILGILVTVTSLNSYGMEKNLIPLYKQMGLSSKKYCFNKLLGCIVSSGLLYFILHLCLFSVKFNIKYILHGLLIMLCANILIFSIGVMFPVNKENSHIQSIIFIVIIALSLPLLYVFYKLSIYSIYFVYALTFLILAFLFNMAIKVVGYHWKLK